MALAGATIFTGFTGPCAKAQKQYSAGLAVSEKATPKDVGLPSYPGARPHKDDKDDSDSARLGLWGGQYSFKLSVVKMESNDAPEKIAEFYKRALAKYGKVLDCSNGGKDEAENSDSDALTCSDEKPGDGMLFKAGTKKKQHIVAIQPNGSGSLFQLLYLSMSGS